MGHIWLHYQYPIQKIIFSNQKLNLKYNLIFNKPIYEGYTYNIILGRGSNLVVMDSYYYDFILFVKLFKQNVTKDKTT
jgi:UDP-N-acetylenolpyruvoylglucosamine reductase